MEGQIKCLWDRSAVRTITAQAVWALAVVLLSCDTKTTETSNFWDLK